VAPCGGLSVWGTLGSRRRACGRRVNLRRVPVGRQGFVLGLQQKKSPRLDGHITSSVSALPKLVVAPLRPAPVVSPPLSVLSSFRFRRETAVLIPASLPTCYIERQSVPSPFPQSRFVAALARSAACIPRVLHRSFLRSRRRCAGAAVINYQSPNKKKGVAFKQQPLDFVLGAFPYMT
jgi:hypothetical protein